MTFGPGANDDGLTLPQWFAAGDNPYFCSLIAVHLRRRARRLIAAGWIEAAGEARRIATIIENGEFQWLT